MDTKDFILLSIIIFLAGLLAGLYLAYRFTNSRNWLTKIRKNELTIKTTIRSEDGREGWWFELPERQLSKLRLLAAGVIAGKSFSMSRWAGRGKVFSRAEYETIVSLLIDRGFIEWVNPEAHQQGITLTRAGNLAFMALAGKNTPHRPAQAPVLVKSGARQTYVHTGAGPGTQQIIRPPRES